MKSKHRFRWFEDREVDKELIKVSESEVGHDLDFDYMWQY